MSNSSHITQQSDVTKSHNLPELDFISPKSAKWIKKEQKIPKQGFLEHFLHNFQLKEKEWRKAFPLEIAAL